MKAQSARVSVIRRLEWDAGHRVLGHEGSCKVLHGHRYMAEISVSVQHSQLDDLGRVVDFGVVKSLVGGWIDSYWDHNMLLHPADPLVQHADLIGRTPYVMSKGFENPTAENIAGELHRVATQLFVGEKLPLLVDAVVVWETPNCRAVYRRA